MLKPKYGNKIKLAYTDTDRFITHIETEDVFKDFRDISEHMDFPDYPVDHPNHNTTNKNSNWQIYIRNEFAKSYQSLLDWSL